MRIGSGRYALLGLLISVAAAQEMSAGARLKNGADTQDHDARKRIVELEGQLKVQSEQLGSLKSDLQALLRDQENHVLLLEKTAKEHTAKLEEMRNQNIQSSHLSVLGATILLLGMLTEIVGALLLAAPILAAKIEEMSDFEIDPGMDLALHAPKKEAVLDFYAMTGNIFLIAGFTGQFVGTALVFSSWKVQFAFMLFGSVVIFSILAWLLGLDPTQSRMEKIKILWKNIFRISLIRFSRLFHRGRECMICLKRVSKGNVFVCWYDQGNITSHPYNNAPSQFKVGHETCLVNYQKNKLAQHGSFKLRKEIEPHLKMQNGSDFTASTFGNYKTWFKAYNDNWLQVREDWEVPSRQEVEMDRAFDLVRKIDS